MQIKKLVNDKQLWETFCEELETRIQAVYKKMEQEKDLNEVCRCQGEVAALRKLKLLREKVNNG